MTMSLDNTRHITISLPSASPVIMKTDIKKNNEDQDNNQISDEHVNIPITIPSITINTSLENVSLKETNNNNANEITSNDKIDNDLNDNTNTNTTTNTTNVNNNTSQSHPKKPIRRSTVPSTSFQLPHSHSNTNQNANHLRSKSLSNSITNTNNRLRSNSNANSTTTTTTLHSDPTSFMNYIEPFPVTPPDYQSLPPGGCPNYAIFGNPLEGYESLPAYSPTVYKLSRLNRKLEWISPYELATQRSWKKVIVELNSTQLNIYNGEFKIRDNEIVSNLKYLNKDNYKDYNSLITKNMDLNLKDFCEKRNMLNNSNLIRSYSLQFGKLGVAIDYKKKKNILRLRIETEQFLLQFHSIEEMIDWYSCLSLGIDNALDLNKRDMPKYRTVPRRRRRRLMPLNQNEPDFTLRPTVHHSSHRRSFGSTTSMNSFNNNNNNQFNNSTIHGSNSTIHYAQTLTNNNNSNSNLNSHFSSFIKRKLSFSDLSSQNSVTSMDSNTNNSYASPRRDSNSYSNLSVLSSNNASSTSLNLSSIGSSNMFSKLKFKLANSINNSNNNNMTASSTSNNTNPTDLPINNKRNAKPTFTLFPSSSTSNSASARQSPSIASPSTFSATRSNMVTTTTTATTTTTTTANNVNASSDSLNKLSLQNLRHTIRNSVNPINSNSVAFPNMSKLKLSPVSMAPNSSSTQRSGSPDTENDGYNDDDYDDEEEDERERGGTPMDMNMNMGMGMGMGMGMEMDMGMGIEMEDEEMDEEDEEIMDDYDDDMDDLDEMEENDGEGELEELDELDELEDDIEQQQEEDNEVVENDNDESAVITPSSEVIGTRLSNSTTSTRSSRDFSNRSIVESNQTSVTSIEETANPKGPFVINQETNKVILPKVDYCKLLAPEPLPRENDYGSIKKERTVDNFDSPNNRRIIRDSIRCMQTLMGNERWVGRFLVRDMTNNEQGQMSMMKNQLEFEKATLSKSYQNLYALNNTNGQNAQNGLNYLDNTQSMLIPGSIHRNDVVINYPYSHKNFRCLQEFVVSPYGLVPKVKEHNDY